MGYDQSPEYGAALDAVLKIMAGIGPRARNSIIMGSVLWIQYCGPHAHPNGATKSPEGSTVHAHRMLSKPPNVPELQSNLEGWIKEWEEIWGPTQEGAHMQTPTTAQEKQQQQTSTGMPSPGMANRQWIVPEVVIDPLLRDESAERDQRVSGAKAVKQPPPPRSLPSLKASGLLDVVPLPEEAGPSSGKTSPWSATAPSLSPRPPVRSPGLLPHPHPHLSPNLSGNPGSPMPGSSSPSISSQDRFRGTGQPPPHFVDEIPGGCIDHPLNNRQQAQQPMSMHSTKLPASPIVVPSHNEFQSPSSRRKHPDNIS